MFGGTERITGECFLVEVEHRCVRARSATNNPQTILRSSGWITSPLREQRVGTHASAPDFRRTIRMQSTRDVISGVQLGSKTMFHVLVR